MSQTSTRHVEKIKAKGIILKVSGTDEPLAKIRAFRGFGLADSLPSNVMESLRSAGFQPARGKSNEAGWKPALRIKIALGEFRVLPEAQMKTAQAAMTAHFQRARIVSPGS